MESTDPEVTLEEVLGTDPSSVRANVCLAAVRSDGDLPDYRSLSLKEDVGDFRHFFADKIRTLRKKHQQGNLLLHPYDPAAKPDKHEIEYVEVEEQPAIKHQISSLNPFADLPPYQADEDFIDDLRFYVIVVERAEKAPLYCFRFYTSKMELQRSRYVALIHSDGVYDKMHRPTLLFDRHIDCIVCNKLLFVLNQDKFQKIFRFFERVEEAAGEVLNAIEERIPIYPFDDFAEMCRGHLQKMAKLNNISRRPYFEHITIDDIKKVKERFGVPVKIEEVDGEESLVYESDDKWTILRVLDDGYLESVMTDRVYEVTGKRVYDND